MRRCTSCVTGRVARAAFLFALGLSLASCGAVDVVSGPLTGKGGPPEGMPGHVSGFLGAVVADEPQAALIGRQALSAGGDAADAAVAVAATLAVTLPSRAGLGGGGACLVYRPGRKSVNKGVPEAAIFVPLAPANPPEAGADRPAAIPMLPRGLYLLHLRYGHLPFGQLLQPAQDLASNGAVASRALVDDLRVVAGPLLADPQARAVFSHNGVPLAVGDRFVQPALATTLAHLRNDGVGDFYQGGMARRIVDASRLAGGPLTLAALFRGLPSWQPAVILPDGRDQVAFLPPPADGGLAAAAAFQVLQSNPKAVAGADARAQAMAAAWRRSGGDPRALLASQPAAESLPPLPATTTFLTVDRDGGAVACALSMDNLFGTGRVAPGVGFLLAASPRGVPLPLLATAIATRGQTFRAAVGGSGQEAAGLATAVAMINALRSGAPMAAAVPDPGRANAVVCRGGLPGAEKSCAWAADPRGAGLAVGGSS
ncbi:MAG TPA: gamma-glutamyltransferase [Acetobacteraceae bacterium]